MPIYPNNWNSMDVALCHDWLTGMRGGERVLQLLAEGFPAAKIHTLIHCPDHLSEKINRHDIQASILQRVPNIHQIYRYFLPTFPAVMRTFSPVGGDLVVSTSHCVAKGLRTRPETKHLCYCFTPMRYAWLFHDDYFGSNPLKNMALKPTLAALRHWDKNTAHRVDHFVAISEHVRKRIKEFYHRDSDVVYPPADTDYFCPDEQAREDFDLIVSALVPYKKVDLAIRAYAASGRPLRVVGSGTEFDVLSKEAPSNIEFSGRQPDEVLRDLYRKARSLIFPGEEDFGIVPVEAMACGCPIVAFAKGGATETVVDGVTGVLFPEQTETSLNQAVTECHKVSWDEEAIRKQALKFSNQHFIDHLNGSIETCMSGGD